MKKDRRGNFDLYLIGLIIFLFLISPFLPVNALVVPESQRAQFIDTPVFITPNGKAFHTSYCWVLKDKNFKEITLEIAIKKNYKPCSFCKPIQEK